MEFTSLLNFIKSLITVAGGAIVLLLGYDLIAIAFAYLAAAVLDLLLAAIIVFRKFVRPEFKIDLGFWKKTIPVALPFVALAFVAAVYAQIDIIILRSIEDDATVGWYKAATALVYTFSGIPALLSSAIFPAMSRFHVSSQESLKLTVQKAVKYLLILAFPIAFGIAILAEPIIQLFYGTDFLPAVPALRILAFYVPFIFLNSILGVMLASTNRQRLRLYCYLTSTIVRILLGIILVTNLSLTGAAIAIVVSEALLFALNYYFSSRNMPGLNIIHAIPKPLIAATSMGVFVYYLQDVNLILLIPMAVMIYFALFILSKGFDAEDRAMMKDIWRGIIKR
jgi:O-antigen/teichoic acid export membrane protein